MKPYTVNISENYSQSQLAKGIYLVVTEATRTPPHIGMMVNGNFSSLTVKGNETNIAMGVLYKNIQLRKIPALFIRIKDHPVFSYYFLNELLISCVTDHKRVEAEGATCLSPVKVFLKEAYHLNLSSINFLFELMPLLEQNDLVDGIAMFINPSENSNKFTLPFYSREEINFEIEKVRKEFNQHV